jgi:hypothetical protein
LQLGVLLIVLITVFVAVGFFSSNSSWGWRTSLVIPESQQLMKFCNDGWPDNEPMRKYCMSQQKEAVATIREAAGGTVNSLREGEKMILRRCMDQWEKGPEAGHDWDLVAYCFENKRDANK